MLFFYKHPIIASLLLALLCCLETQADQSLNRAMRYATRNTADKLISPHKLIYFMPLHYSQDMGKPTYFKTFSEKRENERLGFNPTEFVFQWSTKLLLAHHNALLFYAAYGQASHVQLYTQSAYFRSTEHQLEFFLDYPLLLNNKTFSLRGGYWHRSNGLGLRQKTHWDTQRTLDRLYGSLRYDTTQCSLLLRVWHYIHSGIRLNPYLGHGKLIFIYRFSKNHSIMISKNLLDQVSRYGFSPTSTWKVTYLYPVLPAAQLILTGFSGYSKNIITYNAHTLGVGAGIALCFD